MKIYKGYEYIVYYFERNGHYCGYVRLPDNHPETKKLSKKRWFQFSKESKRRYRYDYDALDIDCHGGLTFGQWINGKGGKHAYLQGFNRGWWIGWDYAHLGDKIGFSIQLGDKEWTEEEVEDECKHVINQLIKIYENPELLTPTQPKKEEK